MLNPLKIFHNIFVQMSDTAVMANQTFYRTFPMGSHKNTLFIIIIIIGGTGKKAKPVKT